MFRYVLKKMVRNKWMVGCLLIGFVLSVAVISSIPVYTNGILQRMLIQDLENYQANSGVSPGNYTITMSMPMTNHTVEESQAALAQMEQRLEEGFVGRLGLTEQMHAKRYTLLSGYLRVQKATGNEGREEVKLYALEDMEQHVTMLSGTFPDDSYENGVCQAMVTEEGLNKYRLAVGKTYSVVSRVSNDPLFTFTVSGVYAYADYEDPYWYQTIDRYTPTLMLNYDMVQREMVEVAEPQVKQIQWFSTLDFYEIKMADVPRLLSQANRNSSQVGREIQVTFDAESTLRRYQEKQQSLSATLSVLQVPIILMLVFYIFMIASLIMEHDKNDITILKSRGASNMQVFESAFLQCVLISIASFLIGPLVGYQMCRVLGLCNGFLEFVSRKGIDITLTSTSYLYALAAVAVFTVTMLFPAVSASRLSIVEYKRQKAKGGRPLWNKLFLDIILLAASLLMLRNYVKLSGAVTEGAQDTYIDPMLFLVNTMFIFGLGLLFLRLYPLVIKLVFRLGRPFWSPEGYSALLAVSRSRGKDQFIALFLILTISLAMFSATAARTLNSFQEDRVRYDIGADVTIVPRWESETVSYMVKEGDDGQYELAEAGDTEGNLMTITDTIYTELPFYSFQSLTGVKEATKVFRKDAVSTSSGRGNATNVALMAIEPEPFSRVAWFRRDLLPYAFTEYLRLMAENPRAVLLSTSMQDKGFQVGDEITVSWTGQMNRVTGTVAGFVDYWPGFNPAQTGADPPKLVIFGFDSLMSQIRLEPYQVWMSVEEGVKRADLYRAISDKNLKITRMRDAAQELVEVKNDPMLQGINGTLTLGFVVTMFVTFIGFLIYWILNIKGRTLQFGLLRAMGLSKWKLIGMLVWEQLLLSGGAIGAGVFIGWLSSSVTVPMLKYLYPVTEQVPPFFVHRDVGDYGRIFLTLGIMLLSGLLILAGLISRIRIDQALKLGEE